MSGSNRNASPSARSGGNARWSAIGLIYLREMRDQLRDRRTLFTIAVLPILLYPILGMLLMQIAQFSRQSKLSVCVVGTDHIAAEAPDLFDADSFSPAYLEDPSSLELLTYQWNEVSHEKTVREKANQWVEEGAFDLVVLIPPALKNTPPGSELLTGPRESNSDTAGSDTAGSDTGRMVLSPTPASAEPAESRELNRGRSGPSDLPMPGEDQKISLMFNAGNDQSAVARERVAGALAAWRGDWIKLRLSGAGIVPESLLPFEWQDENIAPQRSREAVLWSKLLPFIMLVWAMTGAFYPAIDLVAGEKERGTLETLLTSPALRSEIVWGKLGAVVSFSMMTAILNAGSMLLTSVLIFQHVDIGGPLGSLGVPPVAPMLWLLVALVPLSCLFSALALAVAAMAQSSKEGQYYLMPLMMVTLPLVMLPMLPGTTLNVGTGLIPVTGMFLLVRALVEGQYATALAYVPLVATVTGVCLWMATRWARRQFESESVLFGGGEPWGLGLWLHHLRRDRKPTATPAQAWVCGGIILFSLFFARLSLAEMPTDFAGIAKLVMMPQLLIVAPALLMAFALTTSMRESLRLKTPHWSTLPLAVLFGIALHPSYVMLSKLINHLYPISEEAALAMKPFAEQIASAPWIGVVLLMAVLPAVCEEVAFRGFIFGGLVRDRGKLRAVVVSALMFGISHGVLQQSIAASTMGLILGWITLRTGSILPCMLIHVTNNSLSVSLDRLASGNLPGTHLFLTQTELGPAYQPFWSVVSIGIAVTCMLYFGTITSENDDSDPEPAETGSELVDPPSGLASA